VKNLLLAGVAALFLATGTAHAADICYEVPPDNFLATREHPTTKSKITWALREDDDARACIAATQSSAANSLRANTMGTAKFCSDHFSPVIHSIRRLHRLADT
jgi:hypothetical protein